MIGFKSAVKQIISLLKSLSVNSNNYGKYLFDLEKEDFVFVPKLMIYSTSSIQLTQRSLPIFKKFLNPPSATVHVFFTHMMPPVPYYQIPLTNLQTYF